MPQGRRKTPFSGKKKKEQLIHKRTVKNRNTSVLLKRNNSSSTDSSNEGSALPSGSSNFENNLKMRCLNKQNTKSGNRYNLRFHDESRKLIEQNRKKAREPLKPIAPPENREMGDTYFEDYDFPKRPPWNYSMSKQALLRQEEHYFKEYVENVMKNATESSVFELNLETWRQLWRVIEISDCLLIIVDTRYPSCMFPTDLFRYLTQDLKKEVILILNKIDLISPELVLAWKYYFIEKYPGIEVIPFASYQKRSGNRISRQKISITSTEVLKIYEHCKKFVNSEIDLSGWNQKILDDLKSDQLNPIDDILQVENEITTNPSESEEYKENQKFKNGILTIGCVGFPNAGKSSLINSLKGKKVVSVSKTPGHTKNFQTIFLTDNVRLCDCPGLVFPSSTPKYIQVLIGSYPIAQLREPYRTLLYIAENLNLPKILNVQLPDDYDNWSTMGICEAWALKRGFLTAKAARPDYYRSSNNILRMILEGKIVIETFPPNFHKTKDEWLNHKDILQIVKLQGNEPTEDYSSKRIDLHEDESGESGSESEDEESNKTDNKNTFQLLDSE